MNLNAHKKYENVNFFEDLLYFIKFGRIDYWVYGIQTSHGKEDFIRAGKLK